MFRLINSLRVLGIVVLVGGLAGLLGVAGTYWYLAPKLPSIERLRDVRLQVPLRVYTRDERLIAEFGEKRRTPLKLDGIPDAMIKAVLAAEDERFYEHPGVDWQGLLRAVLHLVRTGEKGPGGSTITMQVARNFFLGREKTYVRKLNEILLALKIERELPKDEILELYFNKIFLGHRAYGVGAAAQLYYGKPIEELNLAQLAMIAGLPKAPSRFNPIVNPERAVARRNYVLGRMHELGFVDAAGYDEARKASVSARVHGLAVEIEAPYAAEMVRAYMELNYGEDAYTAGLRVYTTLDSRFQQGANAALRKTLLEYDQRHGYRGAELRVPALEDSAAVDELLADIPVFGGLPPAAVRAVDATGVTVRVRGFGEVEIPWEGLSWARAYVNENRRGRKPERADEVVQPGDVIRVQLTEDGWRMAQLPAVEGALVSVSPLDGSILALSGGFDFYRSKFNRVIQAQRQPGSNFKPFIYSAAIERGFTAASIINDAPVVFDDPGLEAAWRPENYSGKFFGPTRLRVALYKSRNLVSIRLLRAIGVEYAIEYLSRFGFDAERLPRDLSLALGSGTVTPLEIATGFAVIANGGYKVEPYYVERILDADGTLLFEADPQRVCRECETPPPESAPLAEARTGAGLDGVEEKPGVAGPAERLAPRVLAARNAWLMNSLMRDVIRRGTGRRARQLERKDLAGKTGTTNDQRDAWFSGFGPGIVTTTWVGFDQLHPLGRRETGASAALPMWIAYMREALRGVPESLLEQPEGLISVRIDPETGRLASAADPKAVFETFRAEFAPERHAQATVPASAETPAGAPGVTEQLF